VGSHLDRLSENAGFLHLAIKEGKSVAIVKLNDIIGTKW